MSSTTNHRAADFPRVGPEPGQGARVAPAAHPAPQSYADCVAADVAARYGVRVTGPVQIIPRGVSGLPDAAHQDSWRSLVLKLRANNARVRRVVSAQRKELAEAEDTTPQLPKPQPRAARLIERDHLIRQLVADGKTAGQIAREIGLSRKGAYAAIRVLGLRAVAEVREPKTGKLRTGRKPVIDHVARAAEIRRMLAAGSSREDIAAHFGFKRDSLKRIFNKYKIAAPKPPSAPRSVPVDQAEVVSLYRSGLTVLRIAKQLRRGTATIIDALKAAGIERKPKAVRDVAAARRQVVDLHAQGKTVLQIIAETGMTRKRVMLALDKNGLQPNFGPVQKPRKRPKIKMISEQVRAQIIEMAAQRVGMKRIAAEVDLPWRRVAAIIDASQDT